MNEQSTFSSPRTLAEVRDWFFDEGLTVSDWARQHGLRPDAVYALLAGRTRGKRGQAHRVALALGLKGIPRGGELSQVLATEVMYASASTQLNVTRD